MSAFLQSSGKQFTQSPGRLRDTGGLSIFEQDSETIVMMFGTQEEVVSAGRAVVFSDIPAPSILPNQIDPLTGLNSGPGYFTRPTYRGHQKNYNLPSGISVFASTNRFGFSEQIWTGNRWIIDASGAEADVFLRSDPLLFTSARDVAFLELQNDFGPAHFSYLASEPNNAFNSTNFPDANASNPASGYNPLAAPVHYYGRKSRFRVTHALPAWLASCRLGVVMNDNFNFSRTYRISNVAIVSRFTTAPLGWIELPDPFTNPDLGLAHFVVYVESPEQWSARTGIQVSG